MNHIAGRKMTPQANLRVSTTSPPEPLVLLPGMLCDERLFAPQSAALGSEFEIIHASISGANSVRDIARRLLLILPEHFALAGLSMGGIVAFELLRQAPRRISRLALLDTTYLPDPPERRALREKQIKQVLDGDLELVLQTELKPNYLANCHRSDEELLKCVLAMGLDQGAESFILQSRALQRRADSSKTLAHIHCPTRIICGAEDRLCTPQLHRKMAQKIPGSDCFVLPDCGHLSPLEQPEAVTGLLRDWMMADKGESQACTIALTES